MSDAYWLQACSLLANYANRYFDPATRLSCHFFPGPIRHQGRFHWATSRKHNSGLVQLRFSSLDGNSAWLSKLRRQKFRLCLSLDCQYQIQAGVDANQVERSSIKDVIQHIVLNEFCELICSGKGLSAYVCFNQSARNGSRCFPYIISNQHVAARRTCEANSSGDRHHFGYCFTFKISCRFLTENRGSTAI